MPLSSLEIQRKEWLLLSGMTQEVFLKDNKVIWVFTARVMVKGENHMLGRGQYLNTKIGRKVQDSH